MPGRCPKCGGRLVKRTGVSKKAKKQYTYYCCEHLNSKDERKKCDFMTWDVPVKDNCPICGQTMFKLSGRGFKRPFCANPECSNFTPEDKRGYRRTAAASSDGAEKPAEKKSAAKAATKKTAAKSAAKKTASKTTAKKTAARRSAKKSAK